MAISLTVRNGTAVGQESLCRSCRYASIQLGYSANEEEIRCCYLTPARLVPFPVSKCTEYLSKLTPTLYEFEKIAFIIDLKKGAVGFGSAVLVAGEPEADTE
jgi:hypothetical protein